MFVKLITIGWTVFLAYTFLGGMNDVLATNPSDDAFAIAFVASVVGHLFLWLALIVPVFIISRIFARKPARA